MRKIMFILVFLGIMGMNIIPVKDPDFGWHYRCGVELLQGAPCLSNTFSYFLPDYHAYYPSFIYDGIIALIFNSFGFLGLSLLHTGIMTFGFYIFYKLSHQDIVISGLAYALMIYLSGGTIGLGLRPQILTLAFILLSYFLLTKKSTKLLLLYPLLMLLWVNTHIGFFTGLVVYGIYWFGEVLRFIQRKREVSLVFFATGIGVVSFLTTFINPFGPKVYIELYRHVESPLNTMIAEWVAPNFPIILLISISLVLILVLQGVRRQLSSFETILLIFFGIMAITARRNTPIYFVFAFHMILTLLPKKTLSKYYEFLLPIVGAVTIFLIVINVSQTKKFHENWKNYCSKGSANYPCELLDKYPHISGNVFAVYEWGGFIIWKRPTINVFVDGRMPAWKDENGESPYSVYLKILQAQPGWNEKLRESNTDYLLLAQGTFLDLLLDDEAEKYGWEKMYEDTDHSIFKDAR